MYRDNNIVKLVVAAAVVITVLFIVFVSSYQYSATGTISERRWYYSVSVKYDRLSCNLIGKVTSCVKRSHTRCETLSTGTEIPATRPEIGCQMYSGDYLK